MHHVVLPHFDEIKEAQRIKDNRHKMAKITIFAVSFSRTISSYRRT